MQREHNWAGNYTYAAASVHHPDTIERLQELVRGSTKVRALGTRHSFNSIADSSGVLVSLSKLDRVTTLDSERRAVTIEGGVRYGELGAYLHREGFALPNLASLPHISVAGACATATHGSGERNGNLATAVSAMTLVNATGERVVVSREADGEQFEGMIIALGALGVVVSLTLDVVPTFEVRQDVYENVSLGVIADNFDAIQASAYSVSLFTDWTSDRFAQVWLKSRVAGGEMTPPESSFFGATRAPAERHPIVGISAEHCTPQLGIAGPWHERLPHFRMDFTPSSGEELQSEYYVPREHAAAALGAIMGLGDRIAPHLLVSEVRTVGADTLWMSPCYRQSCMAIHFTWKQNWPAVQALLPAIESVLEPFEARPHWGKLFAMQPAHVQSRYERLPDFRRLVQAHDSPGKFRNSFIDSYILGSA